MLGLRRNKLTFSEFASLNVGEMNKSQAVYLEHKDLLIILKNSV